VSFTKILFEKKNRIATISMNRPDALNTLDRVMFSEIGDALDDAERDREVRVIVIGAKGRAFCAGMDLDFAGRELDNLTSQWDMFRLGKSRLLGKIEDLSPTLQKKLLNAIDFTKENDKLVLCIALNYGGRDEIVQAVRKIISEGITADKVNPQVIADHLFTAGIPDPDLIIRTSGEVRTSNYLVWQSAYSEWLFTATLWPDFDKENLRKAILEYNTRTRKFGGRTSEEKKEAYNA